MIPVIFILSFLNCFFSLRAWINSRETKAIANNTREILQQSVADIHLAKQAIENARTEFEQKVTKETNEEWKGGRALAPSFPSVKNSESE